jgi:outer membrane receptor for ferrienterochelin and colicins
MTPAPLAAFFPAVAVLSILLAPPPGGGPPVPPTPGRMTTDTLPVPDTVIRGEEILVRSTRTGQRVQDQAIRVEVIDREEIEEKLLMRPGSIAMLLAETGGVQLQTTSAGIGGSVVRIQGMPGRTTLLLADGLPLYGGQPGGLGVLQIPPVDLEQVEVIKGVASALYGGQALGGVVNLVSRRPGDDPLAEFILNGTSRGGADLVTYAEAPLGEGWRGSFTAGGHTQAARDVDGSGWADLPAHDRGTLRLRAFREAGGGRSALVTLGGMAEDRAGGSIGSGTVPGEGPGGGLPFRDAIDTRRIDAGAHLRTPLHLPPSLAEVAFADVRGSVMESRTRRSFGLQGDEGAGRGERSVRFLETSVSGIRGAHSWVVGAALDQETFRHRDVPSPGVPLDFDHSSPALFLQDELRLRDGGARVVGSLRWDRHNVYGSQLSPRISVLAPGETWTVRASAGRGFLAPTPLVDDLESVGLRGVIQPPDLAVERGWGTSVDLGRLHGPMEWNATLFGSEIRNEAALLPVQGGLAVRNAPWRTRTRGVELLARYRAGEVSVTGSYLFVDATRREAAGPTSAPAPLEAAPRVPLTPRHSVGLVAVWEDHDRGLVGLELYHTGRQSLEDNPFREESRGWLHAGILGELRRGSWSVFVNLENLLGVRQTRWDPLLLPEPTSAGRRTTDVWAPLDGFTLNAGIRIRRGGHDDHHHHDNDHDPHDP